MTLTDRRDREGTPPVGPATGGLTDAIAQDDGPARPRLPVVPGRVPGRGSSSGRAIDGASRPSSSTRAHLSRELPRSATMRSTVTHPRRRTGRFRDAWRVRRRRLGGRSSKPVGDRVEQGGDALPGDGRDRQDLAAQLAGRSGRGPRRRRSGPSWSRPASSGRSARAGLYSLELVADRPVVLDRVGAVGRHRLDQVDEQAGPLDVAEELVAQAVALVGPLDQAGDVGHDERVLGVDDDRPEVGVLGRERIVGDLGMGPGDPREQGRLARVGQADQADVGDDLQLQDDPPLLAGTPFSSCRGARLVDDLKWVLPCPPRPPWATTTASPGAFRSRRTWPRSRSRTMVPGGTSMTRSSPPRPKQSEPWPCSPRSAFQCRWCERWARFVWPSDGAQDHAAAAAAVAAVGAAPRGVLLAAEAEAAVAAVPAPHEDRHPVDEHGCGIWNAEIVEGREGVGEMFVSPWKCDNEPRRSGEIAPQSTLATQIRPSIRVLDFSRQPELLVVERYL